MPKKSIYFREDILSKLPQTQGNLSGAIDKHLRRLWALCDIALSQLHNRFSQTEMSLIIDVLNGTIMPEEAIRHWPALLAQDVEDGCRLDGLDKKWGVDASALSSKVESLTTLEGVALVMFAERFWDMVGEGGTSISLNAYIADFTGAPS